MDILFLVGRILYGGFFIALGVSYVKNARRLAVIAELRRIRYARLMVYACALLAAFGGAGIITGRYTNYALAAVILVLLILSFRLHDYWNMDDPDQIALEMAQFMRNMGLIGATIMMYSILLPWSYSF